MDKIKGITIEFNGDVSQLKSALKQVKSVGSETNTALRQVNNALKFNPRSVELLTQKQQLLKQRVEETRNRLQNLKNIQNTLDAKGVSKTSAEYQKVRREILIAENQLKNFNRDLIKMGNVKLTAVGAGLKNVGDKLTNINRRARQVLGAFTALALYKGFERLKTLDEVQTELEHLGYSGAKLDKIMEGATNSVSGTKFALTDMSKVAKGALGAGVTDTYDLEEYLGRTADLAQLAGIDVQKMGAMMNKAYSKGTVDARLLNSLNANGIPIYKLLQDELGVTSDELSKMTKAGQVGFNDLYNATDKYKGLAQEMGTETLSGAVTVLTQQFGLMGADFLSGVYEPIKEGVQGLVAALKELRANGDIKQWGENLGNVVKYFIQYFKDGEASMEGFSQGTQNLINFLKPFVTLIGEIIRIGAGMPTVVKQFTLFMSLFGAPTLKAIGGITTGIGRLGAKISDISGKLGMATQGLSIAGLSAGAFAGAVGLIGGSVAIAAAGIYELVTQTNKYTEAYENQKKAREDAISSTEAQYATAQVYADKLEELSEKENKSAADKEKMKQYVDLLNGSVDGLNLKYDEEKDALNMTSDAIDKNIAKMKQQALATAYQEAMADSAKNLIKAEQDLASEKQKLTYYQQQYNAVLGTGNVQAIATWEKKINETEGNIKSLNKVINDSETEIDGYAEKLGEGSSKASKESKKTKKEVTKNLNEGSSKAEKGGERDAKAYASGLGKGNASAKARQVVGKANEAARNASRAFAIGRLWTQGIAKGMSSLSNLVAGAGSAIARVGNQAYEKSNEIRSPSRVAEELGGYWTEGLALGVMGAASTLRNASKTVANIPREEAGQSSSVTNNTTNAPVINVTVNGAENPEEFASRLVTRLKQEMRTV